MHRAITRSAVGVRPIFPLRFLRSALLRCGRIVLDVMGSTRELHCCAPCDHDGDVLDGSAYPRWSLHYKELSAVIGLHYKDVPQMECCDWLELYAKKSRRRIAATAVVRPQL